MLGRFDVYSSYAVHVAKAVDAQSKSHTVDHFNNILERNFEAEKPRKCEVLGLHAIEMSLAYISDLQGAFTAGILSKSPDEVADQRSASTQVDLFVPNRQERCKMKL